MAVIAKDNGFFFNSNDGDRKYNAGSFDSVFSTFFTNGVTYESLAVSVTNPTSMAVKVAPGYANVNGKQAVFEDENVLTINAPDGTYARIDTVVIRRNDTTRTISLDVVQGTPASYPVAPVPVRGGDIYEIVLARVQVERGVTSIVASNITDCRTDIALCGIIGVAGELGNSKLGAGYHNSIYRGKNLGTLVTKDQRNAIKDGTFYDLFIGDYWEISNVTYRIAAFDYWLNCNNLATHHAVIVPDSVLANTKMNSSASSYGGYPGSDFYTGTTHTAVRIIINNAFGEDLVLPHTEYMAYVVIDGVESDTKEVSALVEMMSEMMVYGSNICRAYKQTPSANRTSNMGQLPLFRLRPDLIRIGENWWLRDASSSNSFAMVSLNGSADSRTASLTAGCRPVFALQG